MRGLAAERRFEIGTSHLPPSPRNEEDTTNLLPCLHETGGEHGGGYGASRNWIAFVATDKCNIVKSVRGTNACIAHELL